MTAKRHVIPHFFLEQFSRDAEVQDGIDLETTDEVYIGAHLASDICNVLRKVGAVVGNDGWRTAPEQQAGIETDAVAVVVLQQASAVTEA